MSTAAGIERGPTDVDKPDVSPSHPTRHGTMPSAISGRLRVVVAIVLGLATVFAFHQPTVGVPSHVCDTNPGHRRCIAPTAAPTPSPTATPAPTPVAAAKSTPNPTPTPPASSTLATSTAPSPTPTASPESSTSSASGTSGHYGAIAMDAKANMPIGPWGRIVHRFRAGTSADLVSIRWPQRWGPGGYSAGTGGIIRISVHHNGPGDTPADMITSMLYLPGNPDSGSQFLRHTFAEPAPLLAGELYHIVFENVHSDPLNNYMSINNALNWEVDSPRQPMFGNLDYAVLSGRHGADTLEEHYTAIMDLSYSDGHNDGQGYIQAMRDKLAYVGGSNKVRQTITPTEDRTFQTVALRILRDSGSGSLTVSLAGQSVSIPSSSILLGDETNGWEPSGHWVTATFPSPVSLRNGTFYSLTLSAPSGTIYSVIPVREGYDSGPYGGSGHSTGFRSYTFRDGEVQKSTDGGATWVDLYAWSPVDMQFYLRPPSSAERLPCFVCK